MSQRPVPGFLAAIPNGPQGTKTTLSIMSRLVRRYKRSVPLRQLALNVIRGVEGRKNFPAQISRIQNYVRSNIQYVKDVNGVETVQTPVRTMDNKAGDCDDQSVLVATLLEAIGHPTRFVAIRLSSGGPFAHVFTETKVGNRWVSVETTENWPIGFVPQFAGKPLIFHN